ncbi:Tim44 domain-containing protein [Desulfoluna spongiiphila]|uniref:Tim44-like domain-containing protein n=1 Tax=Desulfoluna spongiiphila TaxID=419481 RepID=A0A1G5H0S2_9BACT|nr:Tim44-like domain-containing protein [Desulfoluna spongiiphila]SCY57149.1 Tim44-like domain-containing protein [Desulfoluna spongiiphila]VVS94690.1 tim44-like domain [Desulfoluna spongiiphila]
MNSRKAATCLGLVTLIIILLCLLPESILARAGGGGGGGGFSGGGSGGGAGGSLIAILLAPFLFVYSLVMTILLAKKNTKSKALLSRLEALDSSWDMNKTKARIEMAFFKVQEAWTRRNQEVAKAYMSERLYNKHKTQTDQMLSQNRQNILEQINLTNAQIVEVADFKDDTKDRLWTFIRGSMIDYTIDTETGDILSGKSDTAESFQELWKFMKNDKNEWILDEIDQNIEFTDLMGFTSFSEELPKQA